MDLRLSNRDLSLDATLTEDGELTYIDHLKYEGEDQETALIRKEETALVKRNVAGALEKLTERERYIIQHRIMAENPVTLQDIGNRFNITRERARQIEAQALKKCAPPSNTTGKSRLPFSRPNRGRTPGRGFQNGYTFPERPI